jgi:hypothetical protein
VIRLAIRPATVHRCERFVRNLVFRICPLNHPACRRSEIVIRRHRALAISSILLGWLIFQPGPVWATVAPSDPVLLSGLSSPHDKAKTGKPHVRMPEDPVREVRGSQPDDDVSQLVVQLPREAPQAIRREDGGHRIVLGAPGGGGWQVVKDGDGKDRPQTPGDPRHEAAEDTTLELAGTLDPVTVSRIPSERFGLVAEGQPSPSSGLVAALEAALEAPLLAPAPQLTFLRLELHGAPNRWDPAPPSKPPAFKVDTSLTQKGSFGIADGVWNRVGFQSSRVDLQNGGRITVFGDLVHPAQQSPYSLDWDTSGAIAPQALNVGFKQTGQWLAGQGWEYGLRYRALDPRFEKFTSSDLRRDEAGTEAWVGWRTGPLRLRGFASQTWNNLAENPSRDRTTEVLGGARAELELPSSTSLYFSYAQGTADQSRTFLTGAQRRRLGELPDPSSSSLEKMSASLYHWTKTWDVSLSSSYTPGQDPDRPDQEKLSVSQDLTLTLRPTEKIGSTLGLSLWQEREQWTGSQSEGNTASVSLWYGPFLTGHTLDLWGSYSRGRSTDGDWDGQSVAASATLSQRLGRTALGDATLSMELGYNFYFDPASSTSSSDELYGRIILKLFDF